LAGQSQSRKNAHNTAAHGRVNDCNRWTLNLLDTLPKKESPRRQQW